eukprot:1575714-Pyramimonas_sp.AAC.1
MTVASSPPSRALVTPPRKPRDELKLGCPLSRPECSTRIFKMNFSALLPKRCRIKLSNAAFQEARQWFATKM